jgi:uncharacterized protein YkwD
MSRPNPLANLLNLIFGRRPSPAPTPPAPPASDILDLALFCSINIARAAHGLPALVLSHEMSAVASSWADRLAATGSLDHGDFQSRVWSVRPNTAAGEDIGMGYASGAAEVEGWLASPGHRAILLGAFDHVGVGVAAGRDGRFWYVADFVNEGGN